MISQQPPLPSRVKVNCLSAVRGLLSLAGTLMQALLPRAALTHILRMGPFIGLDESWKPEAGARHQPDMHLIPAYPSYRGVPVTRTYGSSHNQSYVLL